MSAFSTGDLSFGPEANTLSKHSLRFTHFRRNSEQLESENLNLAISKIEAQRECLVDFRNEKKTD